MSMPMIKKITPPTIRKLFTEIPKKLNNNWPESAKPTIVKNPTTEAFFAVAFRCFISSSEVMVMKIGIVPKGLISVKNEVKQSRPKDIESCIDRVLWNLFLLDLFQIICDECIFFPVHIFIPVKFPFFLIGPAMFAVAYRINCFFTFLCYAMIRWYKLAV